MITDKILVKGIQPENFNTGNIAISISEYTEMLKGITKEIHIVKNNKVECRIDLSSLNLKQDVRVMPGNKLAKNKELRTAYYLLPYNDLPKLSVDFDDNDSSNIKKALEIPEVVNLIKTATNYMDMNNQEAFVKLFEALQKFK